MHRADKLLGTARKTPPILCFDVVQSLLYSLPLETHTGKTQNNLCDIPHIFTCLISGSIDDRGLIGKQCPSFEFCDQAHSRITALSHHHRIAYSSVDEFRLRSACDEAVSVDYPLARPMEETLFRVLHCYVRLWAIRIVLLSRIQSNYRYVCSMEITIQAQQRFQQGTNACTLC